MPLISSLMKLFAFGKLTQTAGTVISRFVPPVKTMRPVVDKIVFTNSTTAHTLTAFLPLGMTRVKTAAAAAATTFDVTFDPGDYTKSLNNFTRGFTPSVANNLIAASDYIAVELPDGNWSVGTVSAVTTNSDGSVTLTYTVPTGGFNANARVHFFGVTTDVNPRTGLAHQQFAGVASDTTVFQDDAGVVVGAAIGDSVLIQSNNATAAGTIDRISGGYCTP